MVRQILIQIERKYGLEIPDTVEVGKGFYFGHPYGITVNPEVTLGRENREKNWGHL